MSSRSSTFFMAVGSLVIGVVSGAMTSEDTPAAQVGPERGALILAGGGDLDDTVWDAFFALAGGKDAPVIVLPTALETVSEDHSGLGLVFLRSLGASDLTVLHARDRAEADSEDFVAPLRSARAVWITGGWQWRLADAYLGTRVEHELRALLARGGVIDGTSAGAAIWRAATPATTRS